MDGQNDEDFEYYDIVDDENSGDYNNSGSEQINDE